jgi:hypothetical protein
MKTQSTVVLSMIAGAILGGAAVQGVNAQLAAKKAYTVTELETLNPQAAADLAQRISAAQVSAGGRNLRTGGGKVVGMEGPASAAARGNYRMGQPREGGGVFQIESLDRSRPGPRQGAQDPSPIRG